MARTFPVLVLIGPRQVGKTSLLERIFPEHRYVTLDVGVNAEMAETRPLEFLAQHPPPVILDEVQYAPAMFREIKTHVDAHRGAHGLFVMTGSQNFMLMASVADSLAGRAAVIPFLGLSGREWAASREVLDRNTWRDFVWRGGFPVLWAAPDQAPSRDRWYQGYIATYLERDVRNLLRVGSLRDFERFLRACAARCAQSLNLAELGRDVGISATTAREWMSVLQASNQIFLLEPYHRSLGKRLSKTPKLYFTDSGLAAYLMGFSSADALWGSMQAGALWENHVIGQWLRYRDWHEPSMGLWYWRDQSGNEVDLVLERNQQLLAVECKLSERPRGRDLGGIGAMRKLYGPEVVGQGYVACPIDSSYQIDSDTLAISGWTTWPLEGDGAP